MAYDTPFAAAADTAAAQLQSGALNMCTPKTLSPNKRAACIALSAWLCDGVDGALYALQGHAVE
jgi:hypothetical protein